MQTKTGRLGGVDLMQWFAVGAVADFDIEPLGLNCIGVLAKHSGQKTFTFTCGAHLVNRAINPEK